ncbi:MAG: DUF507 family protein [Acidobacteria bacterium]|nr:DUF507 family protein [Acidobacteriota bacterium]
MLLAREFITYLSRQLVRRLTVSMIDAPNPSATAELVNGIIEDDLAVEDKLNDEVRELLDQYSEYMRRENVSYQEMFRRIKNQMIQQRKVIRASGRDTGDSMKLSRDKITDLSHQIATALKKSREIRVKKDINDVRLEIVKGFTEILMVEDKADREARNKVKTIKREITEGGEEYDVLHKRYYADELKRLGIDLNAR